MTDHMDAAVEAAVMALADTLVVPLDGWGKPMQPGWLSPANAQTLASVALTAAYPVIRADTAAALLAPIEALIDQIDPPENEHVAGCEGQPDCSRCVGHDIRVALSIGKETTT